jgi:hypothetical protein
VFYKQKTVVIILLLIIGVLLWNLIPITPQVTKVRLFVVNRSTISKVALQSIAIEGEKTDIHINELVPKRHLYTKWPVVTVKHNLASVKFVFKPEGKDEEKYTCDLKVREGFSSGLINIEYHDDGIHCGSFMTYDEFMDSGMNSP